MIYENKIALITGSGRGIGRAIALYFARNGADVVINFFRNRAPAEETARAVESLGRQALVVKADVSEIAGIEHLFAEVEKTFDGLDIFIHNAASGHARGTTGHARGCGWHSGIPVLARRVHDPRAGDFRGWGLFVAGKTVAR